MDANTVELLESIRERLEEGLSSQAGAQTRIISKRAALVQDKLKSLLSAMKKFEKNPDKYLPQLDNARQDANDIRALGQVMWNQLKKLEDQIKADKLKG